jgi:hypothetical protein
MAALEMTAEALVSGENLPSAAVEAMSKPIMPARVYAWLGGFGWKQQARKHGTHKQLHARPHAVDYGAARLSSVARTWLFPRGKAAAS